MKQIIILTLTFLLTAPSCKKNKTDNQLPAETHVGAFTFGCKVDGKIYTASGKGGLLTDQHVNYTLISSDSSLYISVGNTNSPRYGFDLTIKYLGIPGAYLMKSYPYNGIFYDFSNGTTIPGYSNTYTTTEDNIGSVNVTYFNGSYNPINKGTILSGTFQMDAINGEGKVIHITEGRFDIGQ